MHTSSPYSSFYCNFFYSPNYLHFQEGKSDFRGISTCKPLHRHELIRVWGKDCAEAEPSFVLKQG